MRVQNFEKTDDALIFPSIFKKYVNCNRHLFCLVSQIFELYSIVQMLSHLFEEATQRQEKKHNF